MIDSQPFSLDETVRFVSTYLSHRALAPLRRGVHAARNRDLSSAEETSTTRSHVLRRHRYRTETSECVGHQVEEAKERDSRDRQVVPPPV